MKSFLSLLVSLLVLVLAGQVSAQMRKAPYVIYAGTNTEMEVCWQLVSTAVCTFDWGIDTSYTSGTVQTQEYGSNHQHRYMVTGLNPDTKYYYRVTADPMRFTGSFVAAPYADATDLKFLAYGDTRSYPASHDTVANAMITTFQTDASFQSLMISVGDLVADGNTETNWDNEFFNPAYPHIRSMLANIPYQSCMGNHEGTGTLFARYFPYPFVAGRYWSFDYGPAHFAIVDQYTSYGSGSAQLAWLTNDLATSTKPWKFIVLHEPGWSAGGDHENNVTVQNYIQPLCLQYHVPIVFGGHNHYYARAVVNGVQHLTIGGGGAPLYSPNPNYPNIVSSNRTHHYCKVEITGNILHFTAVTPTGAVIDTFSLNSPVSSVSEPNGLSPVKLEMSPVYPNPFNPSTEIRFTLPQTETIWLAVYDVNGREVEELLDEELSTGEHRAVFDGTTLSSGVYFARLEAGKEVMIQKMLLLK